LVVIAVVSLLTACSSEPKVQPAPAPPTDATTTCIGANATTAVSPGCSTKGTTGVAAFAGSLDPDWSRVVLNITTGVWSRTGKNPDDLATDPPGASVRTLGVAGDYDGDGHWEAAVVRVVGSDWSSSWDTHGDAGTIELAAPVLPTGIARNSGFMVMPVPGSYDGPGKTIPAWYRDTDGMWFIAGHDPIQFGSGPTVPPKVGVPPRGDPHEIDQDVPVPADYDGDGTTDLAVYGPVTGVWRIRSSRDGTESTKTLGGVDAMPVPADYDGVGHAQVAAFTFNGPDVGRFSLEGHPPKQVREGGLDLLPVPIVDGPSGRADITYLDGSITNTSWHWSGGEVVALHNSSQVTPAQAPAWLIASVARLTLLAHNTCGPRTQQPTC
jgi:hypothetical protein